MAFEIKHLSKTDFRINGHHVYKDSNDKWISNPPIDSSEVNLMQAVNETINNLERV